MTNRFLIGIGLVAACAIATAAEAQVCTGNPSFRTAPYQVGFGAEFASGSNGVGGSFGAGNDAIFASADLRVINIDFVDGHSYSLTGSIGSDQPIDRARHVFACPLGSVGYTSVPTISGIDTSAMDVALGGSIGMMAPLSSAVSVTPHAGLFYRYDRIEATAGAAGVHVSTNFALATFGVSLLVGQHLAFGPTINVPIGLDNGNNSATIGFTYNFGR